jgi:uncharacterized membrane protein YgcG
MSCPSFSPTLTAFAALQLEKDPPHLTTVELAPEALKRDRANERRTGVTLDLLVLTLALELPLQALNKSHHVGLALSKEVDLGLEDLLVRVLLASLEKVEEGKDEVPVEVREERLEEGSRGGGRGRGGGRTSAAGGSGRDHGGG